MKNKKYILTFLAIINILMITTCSQKQNNKNNLTIEKIMPPQAMYSSMRKHLTTVNWSDYMIKQELTAKEEYLGYQIGTLFVNWTVAITSDNKKAATRIQNNIKTLIKELDIDDDVFVLLMKQNLDKVTTLLNDNPRKNYRQIIKLVKSTKKEIITYFKNKDDETALQQIAFSTWAEFLYIGLKAIDQKYSVGFSEIFNRSQEAQYFLDYLSGNPKMSEARELCLQITPLLTASKSLAIEKSNLNSVKTKIDNYRAKRL
jgi:hypothetical protein